MNPCTFLCLPASAIAEILFQSFTGAIHCPVRLPYDLIGLDTSRNFLGQCGQILDNSSIATDQIGNVAPTQRDKCAQHIIRVKLPFGNRDPIVGPKVEYEGRRRLPRIRL